MTDTETLKLKQDVNLIVVRSSSSQCSCKAVHIQ